VFYPALAVIAWAGAAYRLVGLRRGAGTPARYAVISALALLAITFTVSTPHVWSLLDRVTGVANIAAVAAHLCVVGFSGTVQLLLIWWAHPPDEARRRARYRLVFLAVVATALLVLFAAAGPTQPHATDFVATYAALPMFKVYLLSYVAAFAAGLLDILRQCWPYARLADRPSLRRGLRTTAAGAAVGLVYCALRGADIAAAPHADPRAWEPLIPVSASVGALLVIVGLTMPAWGPHLSAFVGAARRLRSYRQLYPLWAALAATVPGVRLDPRNRHVVSPRHVDRLLYRRIVEICDARLVLRPYLDDAVADDARHRAETAGLDAEERDAVIEAAKMAAALHAFRAGRRPVHAERPSADSREADDAHEIEYLVRVSRAFATSPIVAASTDAGPVRPTAGPVRPTAAAKEEP
jgi:hypothetical protein